MDIDIGISLKKAYRILIGCREMWIYILFLFLVHALISYVMSLISEGMRQVMLRYPIEEIRSPEDMMPLIHQLMPYFLADFIWILVGAVLSVIFMALAIRSGYEHLHGKSNLKRSIRSTLNVLPSLIAATMLFLLIFLGMLSLFFVGFLIPLFCIVSLFIPILMLYVGIRLMFYQYPIILFNRNALDAFRESWEVTRGRVIDSFVFVLVASLIMLPASLLSSSLGFPLSLLAQPVASTLNVWAALFLMLAYLQLKSIYGKEGPVSRGNPQESPDVRLVLLIGFRQDEVKRIRSAGIPVLSVSEHARTWVLRDILLSPGDFQGDSTWTHGKYAIIHGFRGEEMGRILGTISSSVEDRVNFTTTTDTSLNWTLSHLLREMGADKDKVLNHRDDSVTR